MLTRRLIVIIPAWKEEASIGKVVRSIGLVLPDAPVLVIDDHSGDATSFVAAEAGAQVHRLSRHLGLGGCLRSGYRIAFEQGFETVVRVDGDGQHDAKDIPIILRRIEETGADVVIGSRFCGSADWQSSPLRRAGIALLRRLASSALGQTIHDPTSGFIGVNRRALKLLAQLHLPYPEIAALINLKREGCQIDEVPCRMYPRSAGRSSMTFFTSLGYARSIFATLLLSSVPAGCGTRKPALAEKGNLCTSTGRTGGACPWYVVDHVVPLKPGGADSPSNIQWQTKAETKAKDKVE
jgi:hypothetical protein